MGRRRTKMAKKMAQKDTKTSDQSGLRSLFKRLTPTKRLRAKTGSKVDLDREYKGLRKAKINAPSSEPEKLSPSGGDSGGAYFVDYMKDQTEQEESPSLKGVDQDMQTQGACLAIKTAAALCATAESVPKILTMLLFLRW